MCIFISLSNSWFLPALKMAQEFDLDHKIQL